jgi:Protein of unknown function (DUF1071)
MSDFLKINVNDHTEKKNGLTYLSWAWAWAEVLKIDPQATWEAHEYNGMPVIVMPDTSCMVKVTVTIKGHAKSCLLPVMNNRNQAIKSPDAFAINTAVMRCLAKAIGMHGLGLYIYAGEDLPEADGGQQSANSASPSALVAATVAASISEERKNEIEEIALAMTNTFASGASESCLSAWRSVTDNDEKAYLWHLLRAESKMRAYIKAQSNKAQPAAA